jgi:hypothetical protein
MGVLVDELKQKQDEKQKGIRHNNTTKRANETLIKNFKDAIYDAVQHIDHPLMLKQKCMQITERFFKNDV